MTARSDDGRLTVERGRGRDNVIVVVHIGCDLSVRQVFDALLPLLPPPVPAAREVALAAAEWAGLSHMGRSDGSLYDLARRWDEGGQP